ncbi:MAG: diguanylate cyclase [Arcobacteraceae bacterium]|nr:diguanylate cyclase [Arcobacteraceae bacterium]
MYKYFLTNKSFQKISNSIITRLILLGITLLVIGGSVRYYFSSDLIHNGLVDVISIHQKALAQEAANSINNEINNRKKLLTRLSLKLSPLIIEQPKILEVMLNNIHEFNPIFSSGLAVLDCNGNVIMGDRKELLFNHPNYMQYDFFTKSLNGEFVIGTPIFEKVSNKLVIPMATPIKDNSGHIYAILVGFTALYEEGFLDVVHNGHIGDKGDFLLIDPKEQIFVLATKKELTLKHTAKPGVNPLHDKNLAGFRGFGVATNAQGIEEFAASASISSTGWFVVSRIPTAEALVMEGKISKILIYAHLTAVLLVSVILFFVLLSLLKPLITAASLADKMSLGELPLEPLPIKRMDEVGHITVAFNRLMSTLLASKKELQEMAHHDNLTKLPNRLMLFDRLEKDLARCSRNNTRIALLFMDLDEFKPINDTLGHEAGDEALIEVAKRFQLAIREVDTLARVGGDEFIIVLGDLDRDLTLATNAACLVANKCLEALNQPLLIKGELKFVKVSIGITLGDKESLINELIAKADNAMYKAKENGKGKFWLNKENV